MVIIASSLVDFWELMREIEMESEQKRRKKKRQMKNKSY